MENVKENHSMSKIKKEIILFILVFAGFVSYINAQGIPTDYGSESRLKKTSDVTPASNTIDRILIQGKNSIWLGTSRGLSRSTDNGTNWKNYYKTKDFGTDRISAVAEGLGAVWAATWHYVSDASGNPVPKGTGLRYSIDNGETWVTIKQAVDSSDAVKVTYGVSEINALPITATEQNFIYDIAFTKNAVWIVSFSGGLRKSTDMGKSWQRVVLPPDNLNSIKPSEKLDFDLAPSSGRLNMRGNLNHRAFSIAAAGDDTLYVGTANGINKTIDANSQFPSWVKFNRTNQQKSISGNFVLSLDRNAIDGTIWAGTWKAEGQTEYWAVSSSANGGKTWETFLTSEKVRDFAFRYYTDGSTDVFAAAETGLYRSSNNGMTWIAAPKIVDSESKVELRPTLFLSVECNVLNSNATEVWIGTNDGLAKAIESPSASWFEKWKVYFASSGTITTNESFAFPNPYNPKLDLLRIKYNLSKASSVSLRIFDFGMNLVRTVLQNASRGSNIEQIDYWDGKNDEGIIVPNGVYFYRLDIGDGTQLFGKILVMM
ncbi:MAG: glycosyl hydrolase family protein [Ignavibacteria bacterium]|nr:MAG: glycosyl hydrolase family protein [Ignavibacteria bacterium]KAF0161332.1 MAG: glycosyl hydrolase family protein [Ignavibacteria bacterium]